MPWEGAGGSPGEDGSVPIFTLEFVEDPDGLGLTDGSNFLSRGYFVVEVAPRWRGPSVVC